MDKIIIWLVLGFLVQTNYFKGSADNNAKDSEVFQALKSYDSLLFTISFNQCKLSEVDNIMADDLEFYHDKSGITNSKEEFMSVMKNGICNPSNKSKARRELVNGSLQVFPLYDNGKLYGAIQQGEHRFYESYNGEPEKAGSTAKFSHLWLKNENNWILKRVYSYNHEMKSIEK